MNMHSHAWPLYSATKLLGLEFDENGISFRPDLPLSEYEFASPLLGFKQSSEGFSGWYAPAAAGHWNIVLALRGSHLTRLRQITVNGVTKALKSNSDSNFNFNFSFNEREIRFRGESKPNQPLRWKVV
jgi:hypothetical protein